MDRPQAGRLRNLTPWARSLGNGSGRNMPAPLLHRRRSSSPLPGNAHPIFAGVNIHWAVSKMKCNTLIFATGEAVDLPRLSGIVS